MSKQLECEKLADRTDEFNTVFQFLEWLSENRMCIAAWRDPDAPYFNAFTEEEEGTIRENASWLLDHPYPIGTTKVDLIYQYFGIDAAKVEAERREILAGLQEGQNGS